MADILVIDDNETLREGMAITLQKAGHRVTTAAGGEAGIAAFRKHRFAVVVTDLKMEPVNGLQVLESVRAHDPDAPVLLVTAFGTIEVAVEAMRLGAHDFLTKPFTGEVLRAKVEKALELSGLKQRMSRLEAENAALRADVAGPAGLGEMVGESEVMRQVFTAVEKVAKTDAAVHVHGESGTGKELVARAIHRLSPRAQGPFVKVNCGALPDTLLESELFGHERGAFTGAVKQRLGRFELAHGGTLFLDEIGDVSANLQVKLLRALQEHAFERVGGEETIEVDVRVVSATHRDLKAEVEAGRFREDLYYRLHVVPLALPPLRAREGDVVRLARYLLGRIAERMGRPAPELTPEAEAALTRYPWPGNVRELENALEQALVFAEGEALGADDLPAFLSDRARGDALPMPSGDRPLPEILEDLEARLIRRAYEAAKGVKTETARLLGVTPSALYYKLDKYGIGDRGPGRDG